MIKRFLARTIFALFFTAALSQASFAAWTGTIHAGAGGAQIGQYVAQGAPAASHTGDTNETILAVILVPAGMAGPNARITIRTYWSFTGTAGSKTLKAYLNTSAAAGGTAYLNNAAASGSLGAQLETNIMAAGATNAQTGGCLTGIPCTETTGVLPTSSIDTTAATFIVITATLGNSADTATLEGLQVEMLP